MSVSRCEFNTDVNECTFTESSRQANTALSVVIPVDSPGKALENTVQNLGSGDYRNLEILIASWNPALKIDNNYFDGIPIKMISGDFQSPIDVLNRAFKAAGGEIITMLMPGNWYASGTVDKIISFFERYPGRCLVQCDYGLWDDKGKRLSVCRAKYWNNNMLFQYWKYGKLPPLQSLFIRKSLLDVLGFLDSSLKFYADYEFLLKITRNLSIYGLQGALVNIGYTTIPQFQSPQRELSLNEHRAIQDHYQHNIQPSPKVSVIIPCYNYGKYLLETVESVLKQTYKDFEVIIINDGSPDNTREVAEGLISQNPEFSIRLINQRNSGQPAISRNRGIAAAYGEYILPLDGDDMIAPEYLEEAVRILDNDPDVDLVYPDQLHIYPDKTRIYGFGDWDPAKLARENYLPYCSMYRKSVWEEVGGYRTNVVGYEDWDFWIGCAENGLQGCRLPKPYFIYRRHESGLYNTTEDRDELLRAQIKLNHPVLYSEAEIREAEIILKSKDWNHSI